MKGFNDVLDAGAAVALASLLFGAVAAASACGGGGAKKASGDTASTREVFQRYCSNCHGQDGEGRQLGQTRVPSFKHDFVVKLTDEQLYKWTADGGSNMPAFKNTLDEAQLRALVKHVRELQSTEKKTSDK